MARIHLKYVQTVLKDRKAHYYFRRAGYPRVALPGYPGSKDFMRAYEAAISHQQIEVGADTTKAGSMKALAIQWRMSSQFKGLSTASQKTYTRLMDLFITEHGHKSVKNAEPRHILHILESKSDTPAQANALRNVLRQMFQFAFEHGWRSDNPVRDIKKLKYKKKPFPTWSEEDIQKFEAYWPATSRARLALALLLYTGQRRSDAIRMGKESLSDAGIKVSQVKTGKHLTIPVHPDLAAVLAEHSIAGETFLLTQVGKPFASGNAFYNWFKECAREAGVTGALAPHGLRKAAARRLAEAGCTPSEIQAITGHSTLSEVERYTREANQKTLAESAWRKMGSMANLEANQERLKTK